MKHTPGPWNLDNNEGFGANNIWAGHFPHGALPVGSLIATVVGDSAEADCNAQLIAAAPELLEACEKAERLIVGYPHLQGTDAHQALNAAIAKARGEK